MPPPSSPPLAPLSYVCAANEGDMCECTGTAYYGKKYLYETGMPGSGTELTFDEMITINNGNDYITQASRRRDTHPGAALAP